MNAEGYPDPTADKAIKRADKEVLASLNPEYIIDKPSQITEIIL